MKRPFKSSTATALFLLTISVLNGCSSTQPAKAPESFTVANGPPEDITADGSTAFVSSLADASITTLDLANDGKASTFVPPATDGFSAGWGLRVFREKGWLLNVQNQPYDFNPAHAQTGRLAAFDLETGEKIRTWDLPARTVGNSVDVDNAGNIYVGDIGPNTRILKIDAATNEVTVWATTKNWVDGGFGIGGMVFSGKGLYAAHDNALWYVAIGAGGEAAEPSRVRVTGDPVIFADGMVYSDGAILYAENDVLVPGSHGSVYRIDLLDATTAKRTTLREGMQDPSGVALARIGEQPVLLVNESQLGLAIGVDKSKPSLPYNIAVMPR